MIEAYQLVTIKLYGQSLIISAINYAKTNHLTFEGGMEAKIVTGLAFAGACLLPAAIFAPHLWSRRSIRIGGGTIFLLSFVILFFRGKHYLNDFEIQSNSHWGFMLQMSLMITAGLHLVLLTLSELWRRRDAAAITLTLWIFCGFIFSTLLNWTINARSLLPIVPAISILIIRRLDDKKNFSASCNLWLWPTLISACSCFLVTAADFNLANSTRSAAQQIMTRYKSGNGQVWFEGHWGFQYYMQKMGAKPVDFGFTTLQIGDILIIPDNNSNAHPPHTENVELLEIMEYEGCSWLSTMNHGMGAGFHDANFGPIPFILGAIPAAKLFIFKVLKPFQFEPKKLLTQADKKKIESALIFNPTDSFAHGQLALLLQNRGEIEQSIQHYRQALRSDPDQLALLNNLAWILATCPKEQLRNGAEAVQLAEHACQLTQFRQTILVGTLAAAYAETGRFTDAITTAQKACDLAEKSGQMELLKKNQELLAIFTYYRPYRDSIE